jgi:hypothetical protein
MSAIDEMPDLQADLPDVLRLVAELATVPAMGRRGRQILLQLHAAGSDVGRMDGLVIEGETYAVTWRKEHAVCRCGDREHAARKDWPRGRGAWRWTLREASAELQRARQQRLHSALMPVPHLVSQLVAVTPAEVTA